MREIKFRAWDGKEMLYSTPDSEDKREDKDGHIRVVNDGVLYWDAPDMGYYGGGDWSYMDNSFEIMQCAGLCDKNGKEIYEGDICLAPRWKMIGVVKFASGMFKFEGMSLCTVAHWESGDDGRQEMNCEVIGNTYENPTLLEG